MRTFLEVVVLFIILTEVMVSQMYIFFKTHQIVYFILFKYCQLSVVSAVVSYTSFKKSPCNIISLISNMFIFP